MPKRRRKAGGTRGGSKKDVGLRVDQATYNRLLKAADEFHSAIVAIAAVCTGKSPKKPPKRRRKRS